jgi:hypothetical protein
MARAAAAVNDIQFSVSVRGIHWLASNDMIVHELGESRACKVYLYHVRYICHDVVSHELDEFHELDGFRARWSPLPQAECKVLRVFGFCCFNLNFFW